MDGTVGTAASSVRQGRCETLAATRVNDDRIWYHFRGICSWRLYCVAESLSHNHREQNLLYAKATLLTRSSTCHRCTAVETSEETTLPLDSIHAEPTCASGLYSFSLERYDGARAEKWYLLFGSRLHMWYLLFLLKSTDLMFSIAGSYSERRIFSYPCASRHLRPLTFYDRF